MCVCVTDQAISTPQNLAQDMLYFELTNGNNIMYKSIPVCASYVDFFNEILFIFHEDYLFFNPMMES